MKRRAQLNEESLTKKRSNYTDFVWKQKENISYKSNSRKYLFQKTDLSPVRMDQK